MAAAAPPPHHEIAKDIGQQVEMMILDAKQKSETMVGKELKKIRQTMDNMNGKIRKVEEKLERIEAGGPGGLRRTDLQISIGKLEEVWEGEVSTLKHELWQTIQAHNHNADLLKHHKDAIDNIQARLKDNPPSQELESVRAQLSQVEKIMEREQAKDQQIETFQTRLRQVHAQIQALSLPGGGAAGWQANQAAALAAAMALTGNQAQLPPGAGAGGLGGGPGGPGGAGGAANKQNRGQQRKPANGVQKNPKGQKQGQGGAGGGGLSLRAEAPEFVPTFSPDM